MSRHQIRLGLTAGLAGKAPCMSVGHPITLLCQILTLTVTGMSTALAAISILQDEHKLSGGIYTPACLGQKFIDRLDGAGFKLETKFFEN